MWKDVGLTNLEFTTGNIELNRTNLTRLSTRVTGNDTVQYCTRYCNLLPDNGLGLGQHHTMQQAKGKRQD